MDSELCLAPALRLDLSERLPSLSEYLCDDLPTPQLREDNEGNLIVQLGNDCTSRTTDHILSGYGSGGQEPGSGTWTFLQPPKTVYAAPVTQSNGGYRGTKAEVTGSDSFGFSTLDPHPVSWGQYPTQINSFGFASSSSSSFLPMSNVDVTSSSMSMIGRDVSAAPPPHHQSSRNCAVTWSNNIERESSVTSSSSRKRGVILDSNLDDAEARKLELKRAKNREAAQRCQQRKQERIGRLETKVSRLKEQNVSLEHTVTGLRDQIAWLQRQIVAHSNNGCHITLPRLTPMMRHHPV